MDDLSLGSFTYTYENSAICLDEFPKGSSPVVILGEAYSTLYDYDELKSDILSRPWMTYRRGFSPIGGTGPTTDQGWGCMLRCGQMMLCQSLMKLHLPTKWRWNRNSLSKDLTYRKILEMFVDKKSASYSIHQIASMGVAEGKAVGEWFGPNTIAQVLRKLAAYDSWNQLVIHVAMDNTLIVDDIKTLCRTPHSSNNVQLQFDLESKKDLPNQVSPNTSFTSEESNSTWRPLLLVIPLRLGLSYINDVYIPSLKRFLELPHSVGVIGGRPNHAHWFIGYLENELIFLDPHTVQPVTDLKANGLFDDSSYHCPISSRMQVSSLDPSLALGFFCKTEDEFNDLVKILSKEKDSAAPMFEISYHRPEHYPPPSTSSPHGTNSVFTVVPSPKYDTDEEYELV